MARSIAAWVLVSATFFAYLHGMEGAQFQIVNNCSYTVWWAALNPGGGNELAPGKSYPLEVPAGTVSGRIWGRTGCSFNSGGTCTTGDCAGALSCQASGQVPVTLVEYTLSTLDTFDISLVDGFNVPLSITPSTAGSSEKCRKITCSNDVNAACPSELRVKNGCKSACAVFNTPRYCCTGDYLNNCPPTTYSQFFKGQCPDAYSYAKDDPSSTFSCPGGTDYTLVFCG